MQDISITKLEELHAKLKAEEGWGTYYMGKYYFTIATDSLRSKYGLTDTNSELSHEMQLKLQREHFPALFHEYIHYLHELSTLIGNIGISLGLREKSIFSLNFNTNLKSCENDGISKKEHRDHLAKIFTTKEIIMGDIYDVLNDGKFIEVKGINYDPQDLYLPYQQDYTKVPIKIPLIDFTYFKDGKVHANKLRLGKFFIYEGLAYELDRIVEMKVKATGSIDDYSKNTEYTVLRRIARHIFPGATEATYLSVGTMSLQYICCGYAFIMMMERIKRGNDNGKSQEITVKELKEELSGMLLSKKQEFEDQQEEYKKVFVKRERLYKAFSYIVGDIKKLYDARIANPTFEVDAVMEEKHRDLLDIAQICDYMYLFTDPDDYMRDFLGTSIDDDTSQALKALISYDHYHASHWIFSTSKTEQKGDFACPFYRCCNLDLRKSHPEICGKKPWRTFELSANKDNQFCWYGQGVLEFKGHNIK